VPAYQAAGSIADAVESALAQTVPPLEIVVSDDGSTDRLEPALAPYRGRITLLRRPHRGVSAARNAALEVVRGDFVANLDADDVFLPERLEALGELGMAHPDLDILATDAWFEVGGVRQGRFNRLNGFPIDDQRTGILSLCFVLSPAVRRERLLAVGGFDESLARAEDWECWIRLVLGGSRVGLVDEPLYVYRLRDDSLTADHPAALRSRVAMLDKVATRHDLEARELALVRSLREERNREALLAEAEAALLARSKDARRRALRVATGPGFGPATRAKAMVAAVVPALAAGALARRAGEQGTRAVRPAPGAR
jgi:glycosyltransferase involved in cell wall biosynthesis